MSEDTQFVDAGMNPLFERAQEPIWTLGGQTMKYGIQYNAVSKSYRVVTQNCGDRKLRWVTTHIGYKIKDGKPDYSAPIKNDFVTKEAAVAAIAAKVAEDKYHNDVQDAWEAAETEEITL